MESSTLLVMLVGMVQILLSMAPQNSSCRHTDLLFIRLLGSFGSFISPESTDSVAQKGPR